MSTVTFQDQAPVSVLPQSAASMPAPTSARNGIPVGLYLVFWVGLLLAGRSKFFQDPGVFWHTVVGDQILSQDKFVTEDSFTFTRQGDPWIAHQWLGEVSMALLYRLGGFDAQLLAATALLSVFFTWMVLYLTRRGLNLSIATFLVVLALAASSSHFHVRPHLATMLGIGVVFALLLDVEQRRKSIAQLWWLLPILVLWTNSHGGVLAGLATVGLTFVGWLTFTCLGLPSPVANLRDGGMLVLIGVLCLFAPLCNPYGEQLPATWFTILSLSLPQMIQEHAPLNVRNVTGVLTLALLTIYLVALSGLFLKRQPAQSTETCKFQRWRQSMPQVTWLIPIVWMVLAVDRVRNVPLFASVAVLSLVCILPSTRWISWLARREWWQTFVATQEWSWRKRSMAILQGACITLVVSAAMVLAGWVRLDPAIWPTDLLPELTELDRRSPVGTNIFNTMHDGGFIEFYCPHLRVFIDDRCELFGEAFLQGYVDAERRHPERIDHWQREYGFSWALVRNDSPFASYLDANQRWKKIRRGNCATLFMLPAESSENAVVFGF